MTLLVAASLIFFGFLALSLSMNRHYRQIFDHILPAPRIVGLRILGWSSLLFSLTACVFMSGWGTGLLLWLGLLSVTGMILVLLFAFY